ncbi:ankyrin 2-3/unc44 [Penicillium frequentans]|uniref:Ankyrin 2-3/unc44 n=1 Tax=Penicillium frequentans TaxID=3151616 RepID=A0AAD6GJR1_9EURO|nr:ankyrin 2-3/unc44 [Penicillium glabrum]
MPPSSDSKANDTNLVSSEDVRDFNKEKHLPLPAEDLIKIREWLQPTPYDQEKGEFPRHLPSHLGGTGKWLTSTSVYQQWHQNDDNGILWIRHPRLGQVRHGCLNNRSIAQGRSSSSLFLLPTNH